jgi:predicted DNA-binding protein (UPF0278 family)
MTPARSTVTRNEPSRSRISISQHTFGNQVRAVRERLDPGLRVGSWGQLQE